LCNRSCSLCNSCQIAIINCAQIKICEICDSIDNFNSPPPNDTYAPQFNAVDPVKFTTSLKENKSEEDDNFINEIFRNVTYEEFFPDDEELYFYESEYKNEVRIEEIIKDISDALILN
tara:strand:- start:151 stop:504 length:354 start_codon:yes stop_codon:yes gene_type:complete